ncbi:MAG: SDR family NAD(P)-dependent oxidoreductase [Pseudomonadota bacterium]
MSELNSAVVWITGASSGIGETMARRLTHSQLVLTARRTDRLEKLREELGSDRVMVCPGDVRNDLSPVLAPALERFGRLDAVIANAGFGVVGKVAKLAPEDLQRQLDVNLFGVLRTVQAAIPALQASRGRIGIVGSVAGYISLPGTSAYSISKFAVRALCDSLRAEVKGDGISVTHLAPGFVASEIRRVDNEGTFNPQAEDSVPTWLVMPTPKAAQIMLRAVETRKAEQVFTRHGRSSVWFARHFPGLMRMMIIRSGAKSRRAPQ